MNTTKLIPSILVFLILAGAAFSQNVEEQNQHKQGKNNCTQFISDLTSDQESSIKDIKNEEHKKIQVLNADKKIKTAELDKMRLDVNTPESDINTKIDEIGVMKADIQKIRVNSDQEIRKLLTEEQRLEYDRNLKKGKKNKNHKKNKGVSDCDHSPKATHKMHK